MMTNLKPEARRDPRPEPSRRQPEPLPRREPPPDRLDVPPSYIPDEAGGEDLGEPDDDQ